MVFLCATVNAQRKGYIDSLGSAQSLAVQDTDRIVIQLQLSSAYKSGDVTREFYYANAALEQSEKISWDKGGMRAEVLVGDCYFRVTGYQDAIVHFKSAAAYAERTGRKDVEADCYRMQALCYRGLHENDRMLKCQQTAVALAEQNNSPGVLCHMMRNLGLFLSEAGHYRQAVDQERITMAYAIAHFKDSSLQAITSELMNITAGAYIRLNKPDSAIGYLRQAIILAEACRSEYCIAYLNSTFCDVYAEIKKYDSAIAYGLRSIKMGAGLNNLDIQQYYSKMLSHVYEEKGDAVKALAYHKIHDSLIALVNNTQMKLDLALQVSKINIQQESRRNELEKRSLNIVRRNQQAALVAAAIALAALITITILIYKNLRQKQKANDTIGRQAASLQEQNKIIENALKEKEDLLKETHHRIKNNLQFISSLLELQAANLQDEGARAAIHAAQNRVLSIASVHNDLHGSDERERIELHQFVAELFNRLHGAFGGRSIAFQNDIPVIQLPLNKVVLLGLILNELITNSFKYSFHDTQAPVIRLSLIQSGGDISIIYYDDGPGLSEGRFEQVGGSMGLYLVKRLAKQLKGNVMYSSTGGSTFTINFHDAG